LRDARLVVGPRLDAPLPQRVKALEIQAADGGEVDKVLAVWVICDGCELVREVDPAADLPAGWRNERGGDYCPDCHAP
jgi:hypothetical protein